MTILFSMLLFVGGPHLLVHWINRKSPELGQALLRGKWLLMLGCLYMSWYSATHAINGKTRAPIIFLVMALAMLTLPQPRKQ